MQIIDPVPGADNPIYGVRNPAVWPGQTGFPSPLPPATGEPISALNHLDGCRLEWLSTCELSIHPYYMILSLDIINLHNEIKYKYTLLI